MSQTHLLCPWCSQLGKQVAIRTVQSLATAPQRLPTEADPGYFFCSSQGCPVVYFTQQEGAPNLHLREVKVRVGQKHPGVPTPVCYCFDYTEEDILGQLEATGTTTIPDSIRAEIKAGRCTCSTTNPQGSCCLGNVQAVLRQFSQPSS